jgi:ABC-type Na+ transport system ATPase subunit NatA
MEVGLNGANGAAVASLVAAVLIPDQGIVAIHLLLLMAMIVKEVTQN